MFIVFSSSADGVHRPPVAGIHGGLEGAYSLALSGGYEDDGTFIYLANLTCFINGTVESFCS